MPTPTATIYLPYHALDDVILRGTRAAQPPASAVVAGTLYGVTDEGNVVERSTGTVWQAYSPATGGSGGAPAPHHATHEPGGTDPMAVDAVAATGSLRTLGTGAQQAAPGNDARFAAGTAAHHASHEPGGADALVNAAWTDRANVFTQHQTLSGPPAGDTAVRLKLTDTSQPVDARKFQVQAFNQNWQVSALNDAETIGLNVLQLTRTGDALIFRDVYEKLRPTPLGHWIAVPYTAAAFHSDAGTWTVPSSAVGQNVYTLIGKLMIWGIQINAATLTGAGQYLLIDPPGGLTIASVFALPAALATDGSGGFVDALLLQSGASLAVRKVSSAAWLNGTGNYVYLTAVIQVA